MSSSTHIAKNYTAKKIVVCCDGTWNKPEGVGNHERYRPTNVLQIARALATADEGGTHQVIYYDSGIGTDGGLAHRIVGGATGYGLALHLKKAYRFVCQNYSQGDELFFFGFSRGAYTVRALSGMIGAVGLLQREDLPKLATAFQYYNTHPDRRRNLSFYKEVETSDDACHPTIKFLGVWDTVGALGLPIPYLRRLTKKWVGFFNAEIGNQIEYAYQALAIDERRAPFQPSLWSNLEPDSSRPSRTKDVCQVWFSGSHSDVGGGAYNTTLSDEALLWMMNRASDCGLSFLPEPMNDIRQRIKPSNRELSRPENSFGLLYKGLIPLGVLPHKRVIGNRSKIDGVLHRIPITSTLLGQLKNRFGRQTIHTLNEMVHESAFQKYLASKMSEQEASYRPRNLSQVIESLPVFREGSYLKREQVRTRLNAEGQVLYNNAIEGCHIIDFSTNGGARLQISDRSKRLGQELILTIHHSNHRDKSYRGKIVWQRKFSLGLKFLPQTA